jgi:hypothetical protein
MPELILFLPCSSFEIALISLIRRKTLCTYTLYVNAPERVMYSTEKGRGRRRRRR